MRTTDTRTVKQTLSQLWFRDTSDSSLMINDIAVRVRAGILLFIPLFMTLTLLDVIYSSHWVVTGDYIKDTFETDFEGRILYHVEAVRRTYSYTLQTWILFYALFEMIAGMFVFTSRLSPTIYISSLLVRSNKPLWKPLVPKRFAWSIGSSLIMTCLVFFNPDTFAGWVNAILGADTLPTTTNFMPRAVPLVLVWVCLGFMWMETVLGICLGCKLHALLVWMGFLKEECEACNNLTWD